MRFDEALNYLLSLGHETLAIKLGLTNTERLLEALGRPQAAFPAVQIAGTNGKGSTAVMLERVCRAAGIKAGLYTSPHLVSITERVRVGGAELTAEEFARMTAVVRRASLDLQNRGGALPTFFEQVTAIALVAFREAQVELAILETGLGGRLDATTVVGAETIAITPVALDHQEHLGETLTEIAAEKAAIIRPGVTAVVAPQPPEALEVIRGRSNACGVVPRFATRHIEVLGATVDGRLRVHLVTGRDRYDDVRLALRGRHQVTNAAVAVELAESLRERGFSIPRRAIIEGLETAEHAGRLQILRGAPPMLFDGAHNAAGARALRDYLDEFVKAPITLVFGAMRDKDLAEIGETLFPAADRLILTRPDNPRAATSEALARIVPSHLDSGRVTLAPRAGEALALAREQTPADGLICVTGSLYLVGEIMKVKGKRQKRKCA